MDLGKVSDDFNVMNNYSQCLVSPLVLVLVPGVVILITRAISRIGSYRKTVKSMQRHLC